MRHLLSSLFLLLLAVAAHGRERILDYHSEITVAADGSMEVAETIRAIAEGEQIRHGIYRDFPTRYRDRMGHRLRVGFEVLAVDVDGSPSDWHSEERGNGVRVYAGSSSATVAPGEHSWTFRYRTNRQLGFFGERDELYWNVTGNGWVFPIEEASATVHWPGRFAATEIEAECYTGPQGSKEHACEARADGDSQASFRATRILGAGEGLTIVASFPADAVSRPSAAQRTTWFLRDNGGALVLGLGTLLLGLWYLAQWWRVGRDPRPGTIVPEYDPPDGLSPGALRRVVRMGWDDRCVAADLVDLGVRGAITISNEGKEWRLTRSGSAEGLPPGEASLLDNLLGARQALTLEQGQHVLIGEALKRHAKALEAEDGDRWFRLNRKPAIIGVAASVGVYALAAFALFRNGIDEETSVMLVWLSFWSIGVGVLLAVTVFAWRQGNKAAAWFMGLFSLPFLAGELLVGFFFAAKVGPAFPLLAIVLVVLNILFVQLLKAPTVAGRKLLDRIEGLKLYLGVAERDDLRLAKAPPMDASEFQRLLPYALALGVEKTWADRFAAAVGPAAAAAATSSMTWYRGGFDNARGFGSFTDSLGSSFGSAISSSSTAPGSSSGGGGGGSSGGGGGGGGGGGW